MEIKEKNLLINTIIIFFGKVCTQMLSIIVLPLITVKLTTEEYGMYDLIMSYGVFLTAFMGINVENGIFRFLVDAREREEEKSVIISSGFFSIICTFMLFSFLYWGIYLLKNFNNAIYIYIYAISSLFISLCLQITRGFGDNKTYALGSIVVGVVNLLLIYCLVFLGNSGIFGLLLAAIFSNILGGIYIIVSKKIYKYLLIDKIVKDKIKELIVYSFPLVSNNVSSWIMNVSDKILLSIFIGNSATGIYAVSTKFPILLSHMYGVFNLSWTESASITVKEYDRDDFFSSTIDKIFSFCTAICLLILSGMYIIFKIMIDEKFFDAYKFVPILVLASIFEIYCGLLGSIYISMKKSKNIAYTTIISAIINIVINLVLIKKFHIYAACFSTVIAYMFLAFYRYNEIRKSINIRIDYKKYIKIILLYISIVLIFYYRYDWVWCIIGFMFTIVALIIINIDNIKNIKFLDGEKNAKK